MAQIAKGSKSLIGWKQESTYGTAPTAAAYNGLLLNNETLDESINPIIGEDIRSDRATPGVRGGNIAAGGSVTSDFAITRFGPLFRHCLAAGNAAVPTTLTVPTLAASTAYARGDYVESAAGDLYVCTFGGTTGSGVTSSSLTVQAGEQEVVGASTTILKFEYVGVEASVPIYEHVFTGGIDFPTGGLSLEKKIGGIATPIYITHTGVRINSFDLSVPQEGVSKITFNLLAAASAKSTSANASSIVNPTDDITNGPNWKIGLNDPNGSGSRCHKEFSLNVSNSIDESVYCLGKRVREELPEGVRKLSGRLSMYFIDSAEYDYFKNETKVAMRASSVYNGEVFIIDMPEVKLFGNASPKISGSGAIMADYEFTGFKLTSGYDIRITIRSKTQTLPV